MSWTMCTSGAAVAKAGVNASSVAVTSGALMGQWSDEAEGYIEAATRRSWVANFSGLPTGVKAALGNVASSLIANKMINYDTDGYYPLRAAETTLDVNDNIVNDGIRVLKDFKSNTLQEP